MRLFLVFINRWWDTELYLVDNPSKKELQIIKNGGFNNNSEKWERFLKLN